MKLFRDDFQKPKIRISKPKHLGPKFGMLVNGYLVLYWLVLGVSCLFFNYHLDKFQEILAICNALGVAINWLMDSIEDYYKSKIKELSGR